VNSQVPGPFINPFGLALSLRVAPDSASLRPCPQWSFELPRISHSSARPPHELRVARHSAVQPRLPMWLRVNPRLHLRALPAMDLRVASNFASFSTSGAQALGCPFASHFQLRLPMSRQVALTSASSGLAGDGSSSCLESRILQHIQRLSSELPRSFALLVAPVDESPGCPGSRIFRLCRRQKFELPRISRPSALPALAPWVSPQHCSSICASQCWLWVSPRPAPSGFASGSSLRVAPNPFSLGAG